MKKMSKADRRLAWALHELISRIRIQPRLANPRSPGPGEKELKRLIRKYRLGKEGAAFLSQSLHYEAGLRFALERRILAKLKAHRADPRFENCGGGKYG